METTNTAAVNNTEPYSPKPPVPCTPVEIAWANMVNELQRQLSLKDEIIDDKTDFEDKQRAQIKVLTESLTELVHLHACEQEGLQSGRPTPEQWHNAINKAHDALWPKTILQKQVFTPANVEALPPPTNRISHEPKR